MKVDRLTTLIFAGSFALASAGFAQDAPKKPHVPLEKAIGQVTPTGPVPSLAVINSAGAKIENGKLILTGVSANSIVFADRPVRAAGHVTTEQFIMQWDDGKDNFAVDPPNATVSVLGGEGSDVSDAVVTLKTPKLDGTTLTFDIAILEGSLSGATGPAALFIDHFGGSFGGGGGGGFHGGGFGGGSFGGGGDFAGGDFRGGFRGDDVHVGDTNINRVGGTYWHAPVYHGAWYRGAPVAAGVVAGAAIGAAAARPYYPYYNSYYNGPQCGYYPYPPCY
ncbi:hypothetical protein HFO97_20725 [Rhizobium leguminosarum]|uniref:hypothetical protein n=1 Tax=Rhizobium leguminosarum TaxID=384 RepID=UPI001C943AA4|nr:hypothetical protein [Rhizobium leguminosarum]MBY5362322.1 hypothetical protein [Rhizobium leguminosarum]